MYTIKKLLAHTYPSELEPVARWYARGAALACVVVFGVVATRGRDHADAVSLPVFFGLSLVLLAGLLAIVVVAIRFTRMGRQRSSEDADRSLDDVIAGLLAPFTAQDSDLEKALRREQAHHIVDQLGIMMSINVVNALLVTATIWMSVNSWLLAAWFTAVMGAAALGFYASRKARLRGVDTATRAVSKRTLRRISLHAGIRGLIWGSCFALFFAQVGPTSQLVLLSVSLGMMAGGVPALAAVPSAALSFGLGVGIPTILALAACSGASHFVLALFGLAFSGSMVMVGAQLYRSFARHLIDRRAEVEQAETISLLLNEFESSASDWLWETDRDGVLTRLPGRMAEIFGLRIIDEEVPTFEACLAEAHGTGRMVIAARMSAGTGFRDVVVRTRDASGGHRWIALTASPKAGGGWRGVGSDITAATQAREAAETALRRAEQAERRLKDAIDALGAGFILTDPLDRTVVANKRFQRMFPASSLLGADATFEARLEEQARMWASEGENGKPQWLGALVRQRRDGDKLFDVRLPDESWLRVEATATSEGGVVTVLTDVTDIKQQEETLAEQAARLADSNNDLQRFAAIASHDLQEPLRKIEAFGSRLARRAGPLLDGEAATYLERMTDAAARMRRLVMDLLTFSRASERQLSQEPVDLNRLVAEVLDDLALRIEEKGATVDVGSLGTVAGDATLLRQVFQNLISNGLKFTKPDVAPHLEISADADHEATDCEIRIRDNGIGFDMAQQTKMFEIFQRLNSRDAYEGSGIGLATVRRIVERHGGSIRGESAPGEGATFILRLPKVVETATKMAAASDAAA